MKTEIRLLLKQKTIILVAVKFKIEMFWNLMYSIHAIKTEELKPEICCFIWAEKNKLKNEHFRRLIYSK